MERAFLIVLDGVGAGELPDAGDFGDEGADTLGHVTALAKPKLPNLCSLGLCRLVPGLEGEARRGAFGRLAERSRGKDTTTGHWELAGIELDAPFPTYPRGFPPEVIGRFEAAIGRGTLFNGVASGTEIISRLGDEHLATGKPIVYTSADSVFQIACHEAVAPPEDLYAMCRAARGILTGKHAVSRVIARPFEGSSGSYRRTPRRRDFSLEPPGQTLLDALKAAGRDVIGIGKIEDIFAHRGLTRSNHTTDNASGCAELLSMAREPFNGLCFANLVDFDMVFGHRRDVKGFAEALESFDARLGDLTARLVPGDFLFITADHGNDPSHRGTDHTREYAPLLAWRPGFDRLTDLGTRFMADLGQTIADGFRVRTGAGSSFLRVLS